MGLIKRLTNNLARFVKDHKIISFLIGVLIVFNYKLVFGSLFTWSLFLLLPLALLFLVIKNWYKLTSKFQERFEVQTGLAALIVPLLIFLFLILPWLVLLTPALIRGFPQGDTGAGWGLIAIFLFLLLMSPPSILLILLLQLEESFKKLTLSQPPLIFLLFLFIVTSLSIAIIFWFSLGWLSGKLTKLVFRNLEILPVSQRWLRFLIVFIVMLILIILPLTKVLGLS